ncbi:hypothetical protein [Planococcus sp. ISL-110]|uniref:hypothetical protein n=1 Tax=Planococcus sp. ISL-110 TaxID=2819167 RepID=UPI001BED09E0|nr:hypothetical protein [Planococcus sp. ISL-110]MBT2570577.1 hypothetical protein [Planococcus sp. ISL-110]
MPKNPPAYHKEVNFYFSRSKGTYEEGGESVITLFARLSVEIPAEKSRNTKECKTIWVDIEDVKDEQATPKMKRMPDSINRYEISEELFWELYKISRKCPEELYYITPLSYLHHYNNG